MPQNNLAKSIDVVLKVNGQAIAGQQNAVLFRQAQAITITNKIKSDWAESLAGVKSWSINCGGLYVLNARSLTMLEEAFMNNETIEVSFTLGNTNYSGNCLIVDFPLTPIFNQQFKYNLKLLGTGELHLNANN